VNSDPCFSFHAAIPTLVAPALKIKKAAKKAPKILTIELFGDLFDAKESVELFLRFLNKLNGQIFI
jgi:hypothetical protein